MSTVLVRRALVFALVSCVSATLSAQVFTAGIPVAPSGGNAPVGDCGNLSFTENASMVPDAVNSVACIQTNPPTNYHLENHYWRAFRLGDHGVEGDFSVCAVEIAVQEANDGDGSGQPLTINLWENSEECPFPGGTRTLLGTATINLVDQAGTNITIPVTGFIPALKELVVEISVPDGVPTEDIFFPGANSAGQTGPTYVSAPQCGIDDPIDAATLGPAFANVHLIMKVFGTQGPLGPKQIDVDLAGNGIIELGEAVVIQTHYKNLTASNFDLAGTLTGISAPTGYTGTILDPDASFGTIPPGQTRSCEDGLDCYTIRYDGAGFGHRDGMLDESVQAVSIDATAGAGQVRFRRMHIGGSFADVPTDHNFYRFIEALAHSGVTGGCGTPNSFCPSDTTRRKQMAVFLLKALFGACYVPPPAVHIFTDVPEDDPFEPWIEDLAFRGITSGCGTGLFCPEGFVKREQMAVFLLKTLLGSAYVPPDPTGIFNDVPDNGFRRWIEDLYNRQITGGCAGGPPPAPISYCPQNPVTRGQMAVFLTKTFELVLYLP